MPRHAPVCHVFFFSIGPQQSPESSIWPHIGTRSGGITKRVSSHPSSIELTFAFPRARQTEVLKSLQMMSSSLRSVTFLSLPRSCFAMSRLLAVVCALSILVRPSCTSTGKSGTPGQRSHALTCRVISFDLYTTRFERIFVDPCLYECMLRSSFCVLMELRLYFLE